MVGKTRGVITESKSLALFFSKRSIALSNWLLVWILRRVPYINAFLTK